jgi:VCBS repeat-containing protein
MATDVASFPQGEAYLDAGTDMNGGDMDLAMVQVAQVEGAQPVELPKGNQVLMIPVQPGQTIELPTGSTSGLLAKIGPEGNLAIVIDGRTIILQGYVAANDQSPVKVVTNDGDIIDVAELTAATDPSLDIQTAAGPAAGAQGDSAEGSGIFVPFVAGPGLGGLDALGTLDSTALQYKLIDDVRTEDTREDKEIDFAITFDILNGVVNEDDLLAEEEEPQPPSLALVIKDQGNDGAGNDPFDTNDREDEPGDEDGVDSVGGVDPDREPLTAQAFVKVNFGGGPGTLSVDPIHLLNLPDKLTSEGEEISYQVLPPGGGQGNGILAFVDTNGNGTLDGKERLVFEIKVNEASSTSAFTIDFTLHDNIDNVAPDKNGDSRADLLGGIEEILDLPVKVTATGSAGSLSQIMHLGIQDDVPVFGEVIVSEDEEGGISITIDQRDADLAHDETDGVDGDADDQGDAGSYASAATQKVQEAGFGLPGGSAGALDTEGVAQTQVMASFGADQASKEFSTKSADSPTARNSIFGALQDRANGTDDGENEHPFELFMIKTGGGAGAVPTEDKLGTAADEGNLTIADQQTNATVSWNGGTPPLPVFLHQVDAHTIVGYVIPQGQQIPEVEAEALAVAPEGAQAVFVLTIDDNGVMTFVQYHQIDHLPNLDPTSHDESFAIQGIDGTPLIHVRISDFDGDHATQPVNLAIQDDGPTFVGVETKDVHEHFDDLSGWDVLAGVGIVGNIGTSDPQPDPTSQALLVGSADIGNQMVGAGASQQDVETFFGLPSGALDVIADDGDPTNGFEDPTNGAAIKKTFDVNAGDVLTVKFNFLENDNDVGQGGAGPEYLDFAFIVIDDQVIRLRDVSDPGSPLFVLFGNHLWTEESGYLTFTYTFAQSGPVQVGFGVMNEEDVEADPALLIDELRIGPPFSEIAVDEDALAGGIDGGPGDDAGGASIGGNVAFDFGADRPGLLSIDNLAIADDKGAAIAFTDLKTTDGNAVVWGDKTGPNGDGWVTWTAIEEGSGDPVFVFKLDTAGAGQGDFVFELKQALDHPFTDDPSDPADTNTAWQDNLHFDFTVKATDADGDWTFGNVKISVDDDGVVANDDIDDLQSSDEGATFSASGNVVTGADVTVPGVDETSADLPNVVSKVTNYLAASITPDGDGEFIAGQYGKLKMEADGDYVYDFDEANIGKVPSGFEEVFTYTFTDKDGDSDTATLTIRFPEANVPDADIGVGPNLDGIFQEDVQNAIHFTINPDGDDTVVHVRITGLTGWNLGAINDSTVDIPGAASVSGITFDPTTGVLEFDVDGASAGETIAGFFNAIPPADTDADRPLVIEATVQDGPVQATGTGNATVVVDAILDEYVDVGGADKTVPPQSDPQIINLGLTAAFASTGFAGAGEGGKDEDGSEIHAVRVVFDEPPTGWTFTHDLTLGSVVVDPGDSSALLFIPNSGEDLSALVASIGLVVPPDFTGTINGHIESASKEANTPEGGAPASGLEPQTGDNQASDSADFSVRVFPRLTAEAAAAFVDEDGIAIIGNDDDADGDDDADVSPDIVLGDESMWQAPLVVDWKGLPGTVELSAGDWSALKAIDGSAITAVLSGGGHILEGYDADDAPGGVPNGGATPIFRVEIVPEDIATGEYSYVVTLSKPLLHPDDSTEDNLTIPVNVKYSNVSGDVTQPLTIDVDDDSPVARGVPAAIDPIVLDESRPVGTDQGGAVPPGGLASQTVASSHFFIAPDFGADGPASTGSVAYALVLDGANVSSGLFALDDSIGQGAPIVLNQEPGGDVVGSVDGTEYIRIHVDAAGNVTFSQSGNIWHPVRGAGHDDSVTLHLPASDTLRLVQTVTDRDGDSDDHGVSLQDVFAIQDAGPLANDDQDEVTEGSRAAATGNVITGSDAPIGGVADSNSGSLDGTADQVDSDGLEGMFWDGAIAGRVTGTYGTLTVDSNGNYSYELDKDNQDLKDLKTGDTAYDEFEYIIIDNDGDSDGATLKIAVHGSTNFDVAEAREIPAAPSIRAVPVPTPPATGPQQIVQGEEANGDDGNNWIRGFGNTPEDGIKLSGNGGDDRLETNFSFAQDTLNGGAGDDYLNGGVGNDILNGGAGNDQYIVDAFLDVLKDDGGFDTVFSTSGAFLTFGSDIFNIERIVLLPDAGNANVLLPSWSGELYGNGGNNTLNIPVTSANYIDGGGGDDNIIAGGGNDTVFGGSGADTIDGDSTPMFGLNDADFLSGGDGDDVMTGHRDNDVLRGDAGSDKMDGGIGDDVFLDVDAGDLGLVGGQIEGGDGADVVQLHNLAGFGSANTGNIKNVEVLDVEGGAGTAIALDYASVIAMTDSDHVLEIRGDESDSFDDLGWTRIGIGAGDGRTFTAYQANGASGVATVFVEDTIAAA